MSGLQSRILIDPETGERVEVGAQAVSGLEPYDFEQAKRVGLRLTMERRAALKGVEDAAIVHAKAEAAYRQELREQIVKDKSAHGSTAGLEMARGSAEVARLREARDIAAGLLKAKELAVRGLEGDRATFHRLLEWSQSRERMAPGTGG